MCVYYVWDSDIQYYIYTYIIYVHAYLCLGVMERHAWTCMNPWKSPSAWTKTYFRQSLILSSLQYLVWQKAAGSCLLQGNAILSSATQREHFWNVECKEAGSRNGIYGFCNLHDWRCAALHILSSYFSDMEEFSALIWCFVNFAPSTFASPARNCNLMQMDSKSC